MREVVTLENAHAVTLANLRRYLAAAGWRERRLKSEFATEDARFALFSRMEGSGARLQLPVPIDPRTNDFYPRLRDALQTLVDSEQRSIERISDDIQYVGYDVVRTAVPTEFVRDESIHLSAAKAYVNGMRELVASSASTEINRLPFFQRLLKDGSNFADACRFGHTYKGSFGFVLESPLPEVVTPPLFPNELPTLPFERRVVQRIAKGIQTVDAAVRANNTQLLTDGYREGFAANGCEDLADLVAQVSPGGLRFKFQFSPQWGADPGVASTVFEVGPAHVDICRTAARELRRNDIALPALVSGLVVRLQNETDPTDLNERTGAHEIFVLWASPDFGDIRVKINLTPPEYLQAVRAHAAGRPITVAGTLSKYGRQWILQNPRDFLVTQQEELPL